MEPVFERRDDAEIAAAAAMPQNRSAFSSALALSSRPSAVTTSAARRLSQARPYLRPSLPKPPPSVRPAIPVSPLMPMVVARPSAWVAVSNSPSFSPASARATRALGVDLDLLHPREIDHEPAIADTRAGDVVAPAPHRELHGSRLAKLTAAITSSAGAAGDHRRAPVDHAIPDWRVPRSIRRLRRELPARSIDCATRQFVQAELSPFRRSA